MGIARLPRDRGRVERGRSPTLVATEAERVGPRQQQVAPLGGRSIVDELDRPDRAFEVARGRLEREIRERTLTGPARELRRLGRVAGQRTFAVVEGKLVEVLVELRRVPCLQHLADAASACAPAGWS